MAQRCTLVKEAMVKYSVLILIIAPQFFGKKISPFFKKKKWHLERDFTILRRFKIRQMYD